MPLAFKKFLAAAKEGHIDSQYNVAVMYEKGIGVNKNEKEDRSRKLENEYYSSRGR